MNLRDAIKQAVDFGTELFQVDEWTHPDTGEPIILLLKGVATGSHEFSEYLSGGFTTPDTEEIRDLLLSVRGQGLPVDEQAKRIARHVTDLVKRQTDVNQGEINRRAILALVIMGTYDPESGERMFTSEDGDWLRTKNWSVLTRIYERIYELTYSPEFNGAEELVAVKPD